MIFKPAELTPLTAFELAEIFDEAGVPDGVFNVVQGWPRRAGCSPPIRGIGKVSLTGAVGTGKAVMAAAAATLKHVTLELGGKSPLIVFEDAQSRERGLGRDARQFLFGRRGVLERHARLRPSQHQGSFHRAAVATRARLMRSAIRWTPRRRSAR